MTTNNWLDVVTFNADGLVPAIAQDVDSGQILMMAWMNREALRLTAETKTAVYYSRSRGKLWYKGETSGHTQKVHDIYLDCDADVIILSVTQIGDIACHTGRKSCFYRKLDLSQSSPTWQNDAPVIKDPSDIYGHTHLPIASKDLKSENTSNNTLDPSDVADAPLKSEAVSVLHALDAVLKDRKYADPDSSYVASLYAKGINKILEKVGEESVEAILAAKDLATFIETDNSEINEDNDNKGKRVENNNDTQQALIDDVIYETADVWFHTIVTLAWFNIPSQYILDELERRFGLSGIAEKASRSD